MLGLVPSGGAVWRGAHFSRGGTRGCQSGSRARRPSARCPGARPAGRSSCGPTEIRLAPSSSGRSRVGSGCPRCRRCSGRSHRAPVTGNTSPRRRLGPTLRAASGCRAILRRCRRPARQRVRGRGHRALFSGLVDYVIELRLTDARQGENDDARCAPRRYCIEAATSRKGNSARIRAVHLHTSPGGKQAADRMVRAVEHARGGCRSHLESLCPEPVLPAHFFSPSR